MTTIHYLITSDINEPLSSENRRRGTVRLGEVSEVTLGIVSEVTLGIVSEVTLHKIYHYSQLFCVSLRAIPNSGQL